LLAVGPLRLLSHSQECGLKNSQPLVVEQGKPYLDEIYWHVIPDAAARAVAFETGKVDILPGPFFHSLNM
jgi:ABC-type transport system substrate-binding protein